MPWCSRQGAACLHNHLAAAGRAEVSARVCSARPAAPAPPAESGLIKCVELLRSVEEYHRACPKIHEIKVGWGVV